jgi:hypothetical protein
MEQEQVTEKKVEDAEDCSLCAVANAKKKESKCWWHTAKSSVNRQQFRHDKMNADEFANWIKEKPCECSNKNYFTTSLTRESEHIEVGNLHRNYLFKSIGN